ncbi:hypothetical protein ACLOJK_005138 [Asimina triloba]
MDACHSGATLCCIKFAIQKICLALWNEADASLRDTCRSELLRVANRLMNKSLPRAKFRYARHLSMGENSDLLIFGSHIRLSVSQKVAGGLGLD